MEDASIEYEQLQYEGTLNSQEVQRDSSVKRGQRCF